MSGRKRNIMCVGQPVYFLSTIQFPENEKVTPRPRAYPHQDQSLGFGFFGLRQMEVHLVTVKVGVVRRAHAFVEAKGPVRFDSGLEREGRKKKNLM